MSDGKTPESRLAAAILGRIGGKSTSDAKRRASKENGKLGGRPKKERQNKLPIIDR
jgi:hypothetical protein